MPLACVFGLSAQNAPKKCCFFAIFYERFWTSFKAVKWLCWLVQGRYLTFSRNQWVCFSTSARSRFIPMTYIIFCQAKIQKLKKGCFFLFNLLLKSSESPLLKASQLRAIFPFFDFANLHFLQFLESLESLEPSGSLGSQRWKSWQRGKNNVKHKGFQAKRELIRNRNRTGIQEQISIYI